MPTAPLLLKLEMLWARIMRFCNASAKSSYENLGNRWRHTQRAGDGALCIGVPLGSDSSQKLELFLSGLDDSCEDHVLFGHISLLVEQALAQQLRMGRCTCG